MAKLKLKKSAKRIFIILVVLLFIGIGLYSGINIYKQKEYEKTNEYKLITLGYSENETDKILNSFKEKEITYILENDKNDIYLKLINDKYFIYDYFYRYLDYINSNKNIEIRNAVEKVNTNTDKEYYTDTIQTDISKKELLITNKYYYLTEDYTPENLVSIPTTYAWGEYGSKQVTQDTYDAFLNLWNAAHDNGYYLMVSSAYRTYEKQDSVYKEYEKTNGTEYADKIAARPGFSEHQTGYALDIFQTGYKQANFQESDCYRWLLDNAYKYGFILRYPEDKEDITGYNFESWHYRYVGIDAATYIHNNNITFDEYYAYFVK